MQVVTVILFRTEKVVFFCTNPLRSKAIFFSYVFIFCGQYYILISYAVDIFFFFTSKQDIWCVCEVFFVVLYCLK